MPRSAYNTIVDIAAEQQGCVTQQDARGAGIAATTLARVAERGTLVRTSNGVCRVPLIPVGPLDQYMEATLWPRGVRGVLSNETALGLYDLSDVNPTKIHAGNLICANTDHGTSLLRVVAEPGPTERYGCASAIGPASRGRVRCDDPRLGSSSSIAARREVIGLAT